MTSSLTFMLLTFGLLSLGTARPVSHQQDAEKHDLTIEQDSSNLPSTSSELSELFNRLLKQRVSQPSKNAKEQKGLSPDGNRFQWGQEQGNTYEWSQKQGKRVRLPEEQSFYSMGTGLDNFVNGAKKEGISPDDSKYQWSQQQGIRVPSGEEQGIRVPSSEEQGIRVPYYYAEEQGIRTPFGEEQGKRVPYGEKQGWRFPYSKEQSIKVPYYGEEQGRRVGWSKEQDTKSVPFSKEQSTLNPYGDWFKFMPTAKKQSYPPPYYPFNSQWSQEQGRLIKYYPFAKQQGTGYSWWPYYAAIQDFYRSTAAIATLCNAASDKEKIAEVAAYIQVDQKNVEDLLKQFGSSSELCDYINGESGKTDTDKTMKDLSKELNELLVDEK